MGYEELGKAIGTKDPTYDAAALHGQHEWRPEMRLRADFPLTTDPFTYRPMVLVGVSGDALREWCNELFGDGILSAIDCVVKLERSVLTIDAKFLRYKEY